MTTPHRMLLVHAHPDDETILTGATMARYVAAGAHVTLVTCTLGEEGEVLVPELAHLAADRDDDLGRRRIEELAEAMHALGVTDHRFLGGAGRYRDSGMMGTPANDHAHCFWRADLLEAAIPLVDVIREVRPQVLITYDDFGGYGHPDHIQAHRVATYAAALAAADSFRPDLGASWDIAKIYWAAVPVSVVRDGIAALREAGDGSDFAAMEPEDVSFAVADEVVSTVIDGSAFVDQKIAAMRAHSTQISLEEGFFALSNNYGQQIMGTEYFRLVKGRLGTLTTPETDLFAGI